MNSVLGPTGLAFSAITVLACSPGAAGWFIIATASLADGMLIASDDRAILSPDNPLPQARAFVALGRARGGALYCRRVGSDLADRAAQSGLV